MDMKMRERKYKMLELRYNPYHDPSNGRFTSGGGSGGGGILVVPRGQKGKGYYASLNKGYSDEEIDDMYEASKGGMGNDAQQRKIDHIKRIAEKNGYTNLQFQKSEYGNISVTYDEKKIVNIVHNSKMQDPSKNDIVERTIRHSGLIFEDGKAKMKGSKTVNEVLVKKGNRNFVRQS